MKYIKFILKFINTIMSIVYFIQSFMVILASALTIYHKHSEKSVHKKLIRIYLACLSSQIKKLN